MEPWQIAKRIAEGIWRRRKRLAALAFVGAALVFLPAAYFLAKEPPRFLSTATILIETRPDRIPLFQEFSPFRPLPVQLAILNSRSLAESVLETLPKSALQDLIDNPYHTDYELVLRNALRRLRGEEPEVESPQRRALRELQAARVAFGARGEHGIVLISSQASKPQSAVDIANGYIEALLARTRTFNIDDARVTREFLEQQVGEVKKSFQQSEETLRTFNTVNGGVQVPEQSRATVARLSQSETALVEVSAQRKMLDARLQGLRGKVEEQKRNAPAPGAAPAPLRAVVPQVGRLREQLARLEASLLELRIRYTEEHPRILLVKDNIAEIQRELGTAVRETTTATPAPGAVPPAERVNFTEQVVALETALYSLTAQEEALRKQTEQLRQSLTGLSRREMQYSQLTRELDSNRSLFNMLSDRLTAARIREQGEMKVVKVIDPPSFARPTASEKRLKFGGMALLLAGAVGMGVPALVEFLKRPVETEADVEAATGLPVLAVVPWLNRQEPLRLSAEEMKALGRGPGVREAVLFTEAFRNLRVAIQLAGRADRLGTIMIASAFPTEGKSTVLVNLGLEFGETGRRVVLADTDFLRPSLHERLDVRPAAKGVIELLHARQDVNEALAPVREHVWLAARGRALQRETRGMLATERLKEVLAEMSDRADLVLCDSSPILLVADTLFVASAVDGVILVVRSGVTSQRDLARAKAMLENSGARVLGVVINQMPVAQLSRYYKQYYRGYYKQTA